MKLVNSPLMTQEIWDLLAKKRIRSSERIRSSDIDPIREFQDDSPRTGSERGCFVVVVIDEKEV